MLDSKNVLQGSSTVTSISILNEYLHHEIVLYIIESDTYFSQHIKKSTKFYLMYVHNVVCTLQNNNNVNSVISQLYKHTEIYRKS